MKTTGNQMYTDSLSTSVPAKTTLDSMAGSITVTSSGGIDIAGTISAATGTVTLTENTADIEKIRWPCRRESLSPTR